MAKYRLNEDHESIVFAPTGRSVKRKFTKGDVIDGTTFQAGTVSTNYDGSLPNENIIGTAFFPIPLSKLTNVDDSTPVSVSSNFPSFPKENDENLTCEQKYMRLAQPAVIRTPQQIKASKDNFITRCECEKEAYWRMAAIKFTSGTDLAKVKSDMIESCIKKKKLFEPKELPYLPLPNRPTTPEGKPSTPKTEQKSSVDTQTVALVLGVLVAAYFLTK